MNESRQLADFAFHTGYDDIPTEVREQMKIYILDTIGCMAGLATMPWSKILYDFVRELGGRPESTLLYYGHKTTADNAAFANGSFGHGYEFDDTNTRVSTHPGVVIVPTALAVAERQAASGKDFLAAVTIGYEVMLRLAAGVFPKCLARGHHTPPAVGPFGAAMAAGKLLGLDREQMLNALAIAGSHAGGLLEYTQSGGEVKRAHAGIPASNGIRAALMARKGLTGPPTVLEGRWGFLNVWVDGPDVEAVTRNLGQEWIAVTTNIKPHSCCGAIHPSIDGLLQLLKEHPINPAEIESVETGVNSQRVPHVGAIYRPENILGAQFSGPYTLALTILRGAHGFIDYKEEELRDPEILALADKVVWYVDDEMDRCYKQNHYSGAKVKIKLVDGRAYETVHWFPKGMPENPMTREEVQEKFRSLAVPKLGKDKASKAIAMIESLETLRSIRQLVNQLVV